MTLEFIPYKKMTPPLNREKKMEVLALGMSRTGTMSLYVALKKLGYNPYHMVECSLDSENDSLKHWSEALNAKHHGIGAKYEGEDFDKMLWRYDAVTDIPSIMFPDELLAAYPNAKVILTNRDVDSWLPSMERSFYEILSWKRWGMLQLVDRQHISYYIPLLRNILQIWSNGEWQNRQALCQGYLGHYAHVRAIVPQHNLLEFKSEDGWKPLCQFLGKKVPEEPYPRINEGSYVADVHKKIFWGRLIAVTVGFGKSLAPVIVMGMAVWCYYKYATVM